MNKSTVLILRWISILPASILGLFVGYYLVKYFIYYAPVLNLLPNFIVDAFISFETTLFFIIIGFLAAPKWKYHVGLILIGIMTAYLTFIFAQNLLGHTTFTLLNYSSSLSALIVSFFVGKNMKNEGIYCNS